MIVIGGGFAGVTAAREAALRGCSVLLLEARDRLGGRTWSSSWRGTPVEYGGAWVHWHQPHTWSEITRAGLRVELSTAPERAGWYVDDELRDGEASERNAIAASGWDRFVAGVEQVLPQPYDPLLHRDSLARFDRLTIAERLDELDLSHEEREVLHAELESLAHAPLDEAGAVSVLRWHALAGYSLELAQFAGRRAMLADGTKALLGAIAAGAPFEQRLATPVASIIQRDEHVVVETRAGDVMRARGVIVAVPLNTLGELAFEPALSERKRAGIALGQASRGIKLFIRASGPPEPRAVIRREHPFGYLDTELMLADGSQLLIGFGPDHARCDHRDLAAVQRQLDAILPGYTATGATAHDWLSDEFSQGTWAIHRPGWYTLYHEEMRRPEGRVLLAGSDLANGWSGFIDGAIESGLQAGALMPRLIASRSRATDR